MVIILNIKYYYYSINTNTRIYNTKNCHRPTPSISSDTLSSSFFPSRLFPFLFPPLSSLSLLSSLSTLTTFLPSAFPFSHSPNFLIPFLFPSFLDAAVILSLHSLSSSSSLLLLHDPLQVDSLPLGRLTRRPGRFGHRHYSQWSMFVFPHASILNSLSKGYQGIWFR